jgi:hypothetical protein
MQISRRSLTLIAGVMAALLVALAGPAMAAPTDAQRCESAVELASAKYAQCRLKAESKYTKTGDVGARSAALGNCSTKFMAKYNQAFARYGGSCPTLESENAFEVYLNQCTNEVEDAAGGGLFPACGDGAINVAGEQCDGGDLGGESCASLGFFGGPLGCTGGCALDTSACDTTLCGNGTVDAPEQCDGADLGGESCASLGFYGGPLGCTGGCALDTSACVTTLCGDGAINVAGEQCDGADLGGESCASSASSPGRSAARLRSDTGACVTTLCGNGTIDAPEQCDGGDLGGATCVSLGFIGGGLGCVAGCGYDTSACENPALPATGQTTCWNSGGSVIACAGTGHDGDVQAGATLAYVDNGDGTITDLNTGLMWEKLSDNSSIHDKDTLYTWDNAFAVKVATLNSGSFAGHTDWRVPNRKELESILNLQNVHPSVSPVFNSGCAPGCTVLTCSCTLSSLYWSSSTYAGTPQLAWGGNFSDGYVFTDLKGNAYYVRAVRGGS